MQDLEEIRKALEKTEIEVSAMEAAAKNARAKLIRDRIRYNAIRASIDSFGEVSVRPKNTAAKEFGDQVGQVMRDIQVYGAIRKAVREAIREQAQPSFSTLDILEHISRSHPEINVENNRSNINTYLRQFVRESFMTIEQEGKGPNPTVFKRK